MAAGNLLKSDNLLIDAKQIMWLKYSDQTINTNI